MNVGILGGGQLGWMTILEGRKLGFRFLVLDPNPHAPASRVADRWFPPDRVEEFYRLCDVVTYEFEHIEEEVIERTEGKLLPGAEVLRLKRSRGEEKTFLSKGGYPVATFRRSDLSGLREAVEQVGLPAVVKAERLGYDGKGQYRVERWEDLLEVHRNHPEGDSFVVESFVDFAYEVSAIGVRNGQGSVKIFPMTRNVHEEGVLLYNWVSEDRTVEREVVTLVCDLMEELRVVGLLAVEFFVTKDGKILVNEFAPRPHNTGHYTLDGTYTSQFENLLRAIGGLPLGSTKLKAPAGMVNILGLSLEEISVEEILSVEGTKLYWYGKEKRERRKMGHVNVVARSRESLMDRLQEVLKITYRREHSVL